MKTTTVIAAILTLVIVCSMANAAVPPMINYQGKLLQPSGAPVPDGTYQMQFAIYDVPTGGAALWSETNPSVQVKGGLFAVLLGSVNNLGPNLFDSPNRFFGVKVGTDPEMSPRQQIASVGFAIKASSADVATTVQDGAIATYKLEALSVTGPKIAPAAVDASKIATLAIGTEKIVDGAVTPAKIAPQEAWHEIGTAECPFQNGWSNYGGPYATAAFMKDSLGFVHMKGLLAGGTSLSPVLLFSLPAGYRPGQDIEFTVYTATGSDIYHAQAVIRSATGDFQAYWPRTNELSLENITFRAER